MYLPDFTSFAGTICSACCVVVRRKHPLLRFGEGNNEKKSFINPTTDYLIKNTQNLWFSRSLRTHNIYKVSR